MADGVAFVNGFRNTIHAVDLRSGKRLWSFRWPTTYTGSWFNAWGSIRNRGLAIWQDKILMGTADCHLVAVSRKTGQKLWAARSCDSQENKTITGAPHVGGGRIFMGMAGGDFGSRSHVDAFDAESGRHLWRFYTVPREGDSDPAQARAAKTWATGLVPRGGAPYETIVYDPETKLVYVGTGGPFPWSPSERGGGGHDELYTDSIVALDAETGAYVWHYQSTPDNAWNFESTFPLVVATLTLDGKPRRAVMHSPKNGFFYVIDARTGLLLNEPKPVTSISWASGIDMETGRPIQNEQARYDRQPGKAAIVKPTVLGVHNAYPMGFSPLTGLVYLIGIDQSGPWRLHDKPIGFGGRAVSDYSTPATAFMLAWDPVQQKSRWRNEGGGRSYSGTLVTAGNLVLYGTAGSLHLLRADTGREIRTLAVPNHASGTPSSVTVDGVQTVLLPADNRLLAFKLGGKASPPPAVAETPFSKPPLPRFPSELGERGRTLYDGHDCSSCHYFNSSLSRAAPDLRRSSAGIHEIWNEIVLKGLFVSKGMVHYGDKFAYPSNITEEEVRAIQAYVINEAWDAFEDSQ